MNTSNYRFSLDVQSDISQVSLPVRLYDTGRRLYISLTDGGTPYVIEKGCRAVFYAKKADGNSLMNDCIIERDAVVRYDLTEQTTSCPGIVDCEIRLYGANDKLITSPRFIIVVNERVIYDDDDIVVSKDQMTALDGIMLAEAERVAAEASRVETEREILAAFADMEGYFKGEKGDPGEKGDKGDPGEDGKDGKDGTISFDELTDAQKASLKGKDGVTPTIKAASGANINVVGTPTVSASTSGTTTTFTFNYLKGKQGERGDKGDKGDKGDTGNVPTIKAVAGPYIGFEGTPTVKADTVGNTTTFTFDYLKGEAGSDGSDGSDFTDTDAYGSIVDTLEDHEIRISALEAGACVIAGTPILMADGSTKAIEDVKYGDMIKSWDIENNEYIDVKCYGAIKTGVAHEWLVHYFSGGEILKIYTAHQIYSKEAGAVKSSRSWVAGMTAIGYDGVETTFAFAPELRESEYKGRYVILSENNLYFAGGILCGHHASTKITYWSLGLFKATEEEVASFRESAAIYDECNRIRTSPEYLRRTLDVRLRRLKAIDERDACKRELSERDYKTIKFAQGKLSDDEQNENVARCEELRGRVGVRVDELKSIMKEWNAIKEDFPGIRKSHDQRFKESYALDMARIKAKRGGESIENTDI